MTRDDIIRMAREAFGAPYSSYLEKRRWDINNKQVERLVALVAAAEREACAKVCEGSLIVEINPERSTALEKYLLMEGAKAGIKTAASAIRARGDK